VKYLYGYTRVHDSMTKDLLSIAPDPVAAPVVQEAVRRIIRGDTLYAVAADFNRRGIPPRRPKRLPAREVEGWTPVAVKQMLSQPAYAGQRQHQGKVVGPAMWEPLIPLGTGRITTGCYWLCTPMQPLETRGHAVTWRSQHSIWTRRALDASAWQSPVDCAPDVKRVGLRSGCLPCSSAGALEVTVGERLRGCQIFLPFIT